MALSSRPALVFLVGMFVVACASNAMAQGYSVTDTLNPFFVHPTTGQDITQGHVWELNAWERGADGRFYAFRTTRIPDGDLFQMVQVSPTTGLARVLVVGLAFDGTVSDLYRGQAGRLYFTVLDGASILYRAPGYSADDCDGRGCVMMFDTGAAGQPLRTIYEFLQYEEGFYPDGILVEDRDGAVYVELSYGEFCDPRSTVAKVIGVGDVELLCGFDWTSVVRSNNAWQWSDGLAYRAEPGGGIFQLSPAPALLATISAAHGQPWHQLVEGSGYLYGVTRNGPQGGGVIFRVTVDSLASPDLEITALSSPPATVAPGEGFPVNDTTRNRGPEPAAASITTYYLSQSGQNLDVTLNNRRYLPEVGAGASTTGSRNVKVPATTVAGTYWLLACADSQQSVPESDETNNCRRSSTRVMVGRSDLRQAQVSLAVTAVTPGARVAVADTVDNPGAVTAGISTTRYYLSFDSVRSAGDILLAGKRSIPSLASGGASTGSVLVTVPDTTAPGTYRLIACADDLSKLSEFDETNNCAASATTMLVGWPDLVTTAIAGLPAQAVIGRSMSVSDTVRNQGQVAAGSSAMRYYFSLDTVKSAGDFALTGGRPVAALAPGATSSGGSNVKVPSIATGAYYVLACADGTSKVGESQEGNNCRSSATTVAVHP